jgi:hypothetical protein
MMVKQKSGIEAGKAKNRISELEDRERMTESALATIRQNEPAAALKNCRRLADQINAKLLHTQPKDFIEPSAVEELQAFLERAAAVLKKL